MDGHTQERPTWKQAVDKHVDVLKDHLEFWEGITKDQSIDGTLRQAAQKGIGETQTMIASWSKFNARASKIHDVDPPVATNVSLKRSADESEDEIREKPKKKTKSTTSQAGNEDPSPATARPTLSPANDASGLFMVDTNPSDVKDLLNEFGRKPRWDSGKKRRRREENNADTLQSESAADENYLNGKRKKQDHKAEAQEQPEDDDAHHKSFEAKVELRLKEKEEQRKQKTNKKRKRPSEDFGQEAVGSGGAPQAQNRDQRRKERAQRQSEEGHKQQKSEDATNVTESSQPNGFSQDVPNAASEGKKWKGYRQERADKQKRKSEAQEVASKKRRKIHL